jgi:D-glycero-D-manno-heptose 1,7-bisphosphate phosphatase
VGRPAVFLDRDGVVNRAEVRDGVPHPPVRLRDFELLPGVAEAVRRLRDASFAIVIVTNQPDVARGRQQRTVVEAMNKVVQEALVLDAIVVCYHDNSDASACRKPAPGMLLTAAEELKIDLATSFMVGDRWRDIEAGRRAGCRTVFLDRGYDETQPEQPDVIVSDLPDAVAWILPFVAQKEAQIA